MSWQSEATHEKIARLRATLAQVQDELIEAEAQLADQLAEVSAFEFEFEAKVGYLLDKLAQLEAEVADYLDRIQRLRNRRVFGSDYRSVDEQYRRTWQAPPESAVQAPPKPLSPATETQIKKLYRQLARSFHPDLASDDADRAYRTDKMTAVNNAYAARSMAELQALAQEAEAYQKGRPGRSRQTEVEMVEALEKELARCQRRLREIDFEMQNIHNRPSVSLSLDVKFAQRQGRDLLAEMAAELKRKIAHKTAERDMIKAQFEQLKRDE